jgi:hypothetical protein
VIRHYPPEPTEGLSVHTESSNFQVIGEDIDEQTLYRIENKLVRVLREFTIYCQKSRILSSLEDYKETPLCAGGFVRPFSTSEEDDGLEEDVSDEGPHLQYIETGTITSVSKIEK